MMRDSQQQQQQQQLDLEAHNGTALPTTDDTDGEEEASYMSVSYMSASYINTSYFGGDDESTVGAMTTETDLIRDAAAAVRNGNLGQQQQQQFYNDNNNDDDDDDEPTSYGRIMVGKDYSLYDLNVDNDNDQSAEFENVDLENGDKKSAAPTATMAQQPPEQSPQQQSVVVDTNKTERGMGRLELAFLSTLVFVIAFLAIYFISSKFL